MLDSGATDLLKQIDRNVRNKQLPHAGPTESSTTPARQRGGQSAALRAPPSKAPPARAWLSETCQVRSGVRVVHQKPRLWCR